MRLRMFLAAGLALPLVGGCGGYYILSVPDQVAPAGAEAPVVVRLQRNDFLVLAFPAKGAAMRFRLGDGPQRGAYTDDLGYAGVTVKAPDRPGRVELSVDHMDFDGDEIGGKGCLYVWDPGRPIVAVDADCLPMPLPVKVNPSRAMGSAWEKTAIFLHLKRPATQPAEPRRVPAEKAGAHGAVREAVEALERIAASAHVLYLTRRRLMEHADLHEDLAKLGYPDGPVLLWKRQGWHIVREGKYGLPKVVVEGRLVHMLPELRKAFSGLTMGICDSPLSARAFTDAGLRCTVVGGLLPGGGPNVKRVSRWSQVEVPAGP